MGQKLGRGLCPFGEGELGPHLTQCARAEAYLHAKFHFDPSDRLATAHQRDRQTDRRDRQTGQRSDSIGRNRRTTGSLLVIGIEDTEDSKPKDGRR